MCKYIKPTVPQGATADERRAIYFDALYSLDMNDKVDKRENLSYLSWANAWAEFKRAYPSATYKIVKDPITSLPYFTDERTGIIVYTEVTVDSVTHEMWLPVMNTSNKAMKLEPYTYKAFDKFKKQYVEKTVEAASMFDINKTLMRCLVKNLAMFGLGLYIYAGEDIPDKIIEENNSDQERESEQPKRTRRSKTVQQPVADKYAGIRTALQQCGTQDSLMELYKQHQGEVTANSEIKALFTERKLQLQKAA